MNWFEVVLVIGVIYSVIYIFIYKPIHNSNVDKRQALFNERFKSVYKGMTKKEFLKLFRNIKYKEKRKKIIFDFTKKGIRKDKGDYYEFYFSGDKLQDYKKFERTVTYHTYHY